ncbi:hypothetical protein BMS3Abin07_02547 [bacterium BMS3Abin07]|nr:hypothetical protein BMS3Abin07_02547 [bacterium BMS3Abin07]GBE31758.1 hypothetical protein BMS3Bbin05_00661 [bacterium BMS3Bbin05]HDL20473.1 hypothetical protein [Nitrospirota bacterium]HDO22425.1 hypothetical protein [Nitrospirota bacterium]HDZ87373.1 hypothetical protein [Nitrospirota bacterium]
MAKAVSVSIEGDNIKVVFATLKGKKIIVNDSFVLPDEKFDDFLSSVKAKDFIVSVDFNNYFQDSVLIPPVKKSLTSAVIISELKKKNANVADITPLFFRVGQKKVDGKMLNEYFVFYVETPEVDNIVRRFLSKGKRIRALYPNMMSALKILPVQERPYLFFHEIGGRKNISLIDNGRMLFARSFQSIGEGIADYDIQNINMTVNYCIQALRITPEKIMIAGSGDDTSSASMQATIPSVHFSRPGTIEVDNEIFTNYLVPISALGHGRMKSIFTDGYRRFSILSNLIRYSTASFTILSLLLAGLLGVNLVKYSSLKSRLSSIRSLHNNLRPVINKYNSEKKSLESRKPMADFINSMTGQPSVAGLLYALSGLRTNGISIDTFQMEYDGGKTLKLRMGGKAGAGSLYVSQQDLDNLVAGLKKTRGIKDVVGELSLKSMTFSIHSVYEEE